MLKLWEKATSEFAAYHPPPQLPRAARMRQQSTACEGHGQRARVSSTEHAHADSSSSAAIAAAAAAVAAAGEAMART